MSVPLNGHPGRLTNPSQCLGKRAFRLQAVNNSFHGSNRGRGWIGNT